MTHSKHSDEAPEENLFAAPDIADPAVSTIVNREPGGLAVAISITLAIIVSVPVFMVTFFFTCLGISGIRSLDNEAGLVLVSLIAFATSVVSVILVTKGLLAIVRIFKNT
jgi:hypothetical protein